MLFHIDEAKYRIIDLSTHVRAPGTEDRPLRVRRGLLADDTFKHDVATHTHVGTHIESPAHFFEGGREICTYPLERFYGPAVLFETAGIDREEVDAATFDADIGSLMAPGHIVVCRNTHPQWRSVHAEDRHRMPYLVPSGAQWLVDHQAKLVVMDDFSGIRVGDGKEISRQNHAILMGPGAEIPILEFPDGLERITRRQFFFMALPLSLSGVDSVWARAIAIEER